MSRKISGPRNKVSWKKKKQHLVQTRSKHKRLQKRVQRSPNLKAPSSPSPPFSPVPFNLFPHHSLSYSHAPLSFSFFFLFQFLFIIPLLALQPPALAHPFTSDPTGTLCAAPHNEVASLSHVNAFTYSPVAGDGGA